MEISHLIKVHLISLIRCEVMVHLGYHIPLGDAFIQKAYLLSHSVNKLSCLRFGHSHAYWKQYTILRDDLYPQCVVKDSVNINLVNNELRS